MSIPGTTQRVTLRTLLVLGRVSNLPTVWSNCLAGWVLGGGGAAWQFAVLCFGATCLYIGGMYLNDAFDTEFDQQHRCERPIPSGAIRLETVWQLGFVWLALGLGSLLLLGREVFVLTLLLAGAIVLYDAIHKKTVLSPVFMALCRFLLFLMAAAAGDGGLGGLAWWSALALAAYIVGLSYVARFESAPGALRYWPLILLAAPVVLAYFVNAGDYRWRSIWLSLLLLVWIGMCLRFTFVAERRNFGRTVSGLLAGIVLVDLLAVCGQPPVAEAFPVLLMMALVFQWFIPAT